MLKNKAVFLGQPYLFEEKNVIVLATSSLLFRCFYLMLL